ncbi:double-cubane-cluster-containing anaerobic reductase [Methanothermococcus okinawensis]|uniref:2-hydroxyglutaryl-CoA dehydratase D-component n=1 Tax=Methanothermococcus okinawensis (strain DSM 14208 / JCM 11175 / IH1) TaxID=647113 RepID=F8AKI2_METOI|nr:double-cubane-cluster-containing anaerobic reductase [Methanothermococcus okinawensis]AEH07508.1 2-hydroxyglutaryl-CoA dehydratase D-component [Methanothermococcus okinawensis IH1]
MGDIKAMDKLMDKFRSRKDELYKQKEEGKKVFGLFCSFVPIELVLAADSIPVGLCGGKDSTIPAAEEDLPRNICPLIKSSYGFKKTKACPYFEAADIVVGETTCDAKKKMFELLEKFVPMHVMQIPHFKDEKSFKLWLSEVEEFKELVEKSTGNKITDDKLKESIDKVNKMRKLFYKIYELRAKDPSPIKGADALKLFQFAYLLDVNDTIAILEELVEELKERVANNKGHKGKRILISGCPMVAGNSKVVDLIEECGGIVVGEESCTGTRQFENLVEGYTVEDLARRYFNITCALAFKNDNRIKRIKELVKELNVEGVVYYSLQYCHTFNVEGVRVEEELKKEGIPIIRIETDYSESDKEQLKTRLEAFIEMI